MEKIHCAIIGTGRIASALEDDRKREKPATHAGAISLNRSALLAGGADTDQAALQAFGKRWKLGADRLFPSAEEMLDKLKPDIVHIASGTEWHTRHLQYALDRKIPVLVLEKPVAGSVAEAAAVRKALKKSSSKIVVNHERRFAADYNRAKQIIAARKYGELLCIYANLYMGREKQVSKVLWHDGTHMIDLFRFLLGGDFTAEKTMGNPASAKTNVFLFGRKGKCSVVLDCSPGRDYLHFELELGFERGRVRVGNGIYSEEKSAPSPFYESYRSLVPAGSKRKFGKTGYFSNMMEHAVQLFRNPELESRSGYEDGIRALEIIQQYLDMKDE